MAALGAPIQIDGSYGEGGGALLRTAVVMASLTQQPLRLSNIRGGTKYPGLDLEDILLIKALSRSCQAELVGVEAGSLSLSFLPTRRPKGLNESLDLELDSGRTRGANVNVVLNALLPVLARTGAYSRVALSGETYGQHSLSYDYFANVTVFALRRLGLYAFPDQEYAGFGREARGRVVMEVEPSALTGMQWQERGKLQEVRATIAVGELSMAVAHRATSHLNSLAANAKVPLETDIVGVDSDRPGVFVTVWALYENGMGGSTAMGAKGVRVESVAQTAFEETWQWMSGDSTVDPFLADQILLPAALSDGGTVFKTPVLTQRLLTSIWVIKQFLPIHITVKGSEREPGTVTIRR